MEKCPQCGNYALEFDVYHKRARCLMAACDFRDWSCSTREAYDAKVAERKRVDDWNNLCEALKAEPNADISALADAAMDMRAQLEGQCQ